MDVRVGLWRKLSAEELMLLNCGIGEDFCESLGLQGDPSSLFWRRSVLISLEGMMLKLKLRTLATSCEELSHWKRLWCWEGLWAGGEGDDREWDSWMALLTWRESEWTLGVGDGQVGLVCCDSWGRIESDMTQQLSWLTKLILYWCFSFWTSVYIIGSNFIHLIRTYSNAFFLIAE